MTFDNIIDKLHMESIVDDFLEWHHDNSISESVQFDLDLIEKDLCELVTGYKLGFGLIDLE